MLHAGAEGRSQCSSWLAPGWLQRCHARGRTARQSVDTDLDTKRHGIAPTGRTGRQAGQTSAWSAAQKDPGANAPDAGPGQLEVLVGAIPWGLKSPLRHMK